MQYCLLLCTIYSVDTFRATCYALGGVLYDLKGGIMLEFRFDVVEALKEKGYSTYYIRKNTSIGQKTFSDIKRGVVPGIKTIDILCALLGCQPGDMLKYTPEKKME